MIKYVVAHFDPGPSPMAYVVHAPGSPITSALCGKPHEATFFIAAPYALTEVNCIPCVVASASRAPLAP